MTDRIIGTVKWFNKAKGYGFIVDEKSPLDDIFVHYSAIEMDGYRFLEEGDHVELIVQQTSKGLQASGVTKVL
jgi:CspA family cold shock protein